MSRLRTSNAKTMGKMLPLALVVCLLPALVAYAASRRHVFRGPGAGKISIDRGSGTTLLPAPGAPPAQLALRLGNSSGTRRYVTRLTVAVRSPAGCSAAQNLRIVQSSVSPRHPIWVPGKGSVTLPAQGISPPTIQLVNRPVSQDGCKGARFPLRFRFEERVRR